MDKPYDKQAESIMCYVVLNAMSNRQTFLFCKNASWNNCFMTFMAFISVKMTKILIIYCNNLQAGNWLQWLKLVKSCFHRSKFNFTLDSLKIFHWESNLQRIIKEFVACFNHQKFWEREKEVVTSFWYYRCVKRSHKEMRML